MAQSYRMTSYLPVPQRCPLAQAVALSLALGAGSGVAYAATFNVSNTADSGAGSLRDAVAQANGAAGPDVITFNNGLGTITLTSGQIDITETLTISGPAAGQTISGNNNSRVFRVTATAADLTLENLTLTAGATTTDGGSPVCAPDSGDGGAVCALGNLTLTNSTVSASSTSGFFALGGGLYVYGNATLSNSTVSGNSTTGVFASGGGLAVYSNATLSNSTVSGNSTTGFAAAGGGLAVYSNATLSNSTVSGNSTTGYAAYGGGLYVYGNATLTNSTVSNNSTAGDDAYGGGLAVYGNVTLTNSTVSGNSTTGYAADGGGLDVYGNATLSNSTVSGNSTADNYAEGGGIFVYGTATLTDSTISNNSTAGYTADGGGLLVLGNATLTNSTVSNNSTNDDDADGGGISAYGDVTLTNSTVSGNSTAGDYADGGGLLVRGNATLTNSIVSGNSTEGDYADGGGISVRGDGLFTNSIVSDNSTIGEDSDGGGIDGDENITLINSTVSGNSTADDDADGGGLLARGNATLTNSTVSNNSTAGDDAYGGGIAVRGDATLNNSTVSGNSTTGTDAYGGGLYADGTVTLTSTILAGNTGDEDNLSAGGTVNVSFSLFGDDASEINGTNSNNVFNDAPGLAALADNGCAQLAGAPGSAACVQTQALQAGSPALDAADSAVCTAAPVNGLDQRGGLRGFNATGTPDDPAPGDCDIGAYELSADTLTIIKQTLPDGSATAFTFSGALAGAISDGEQLSAELSPGQYSVSETVPAGWDLIDISCDNDAVTTDLNMASIALTLNGTGSATTCTFTNRQRAQLNISVDVFGPDFNTTFGFTTSGGLSPSNFSLHGGETQSFSGLIPDQTYTVNEQVPANWVLEEILCSEPPPVCETGSIIVTPEPGQSIDATFRFRPGLSGEPTSPQTIPALSLWGLGGLISLFGLVLGWRWRRG
ncbi:MAG: right-handed parallel beta-helix repeat-containing protein [Gammaproteobacteria bacterium]